MPNVSKVILTRPHVLAVMPLSDTPQAKEHDFPLVMDHATTYTNMCALCFLRTYLGYLAKCSSISDELTFYKAEVRARITAVGKAEIILHDVCQAMATRLGRADGTNILLNKGKILSEVELTTLLVVGELTLTDKNGSSLR